MVNTPIRKVAVSGFKISGFPASGIFFLGVDDSAIRRNVKTDDGEYGIARFSSRGGKIVANKASGADEAGIYVGDSPHANVLVAANEAADNGAFGFFFRDAASGTVVGNRAHGNCVGAGAQHGRQHRGRLALHREQGDREQQVLLGQRGGG